MEFTGYSQVFSTQDGQQYESIGAFWDGMSARFGLEKLRGLGFHWTENTIEYAIGFKDGAIPPGLAIPHAVYKTVLLPEDGWAAYTGETEKLAELYEEIYKAGPLTYEIETFRQDDTCAVWIYR